MSDGAAPGAAPPATVPSLRLAALPRELRLFLTGFLVALSLGYGLGLAHVVERSGATVPGIQGRYGPEETDTDYPKSLGEMLETTHNHTLTFALIFFALGCVFSLSDVGSPWKGLLLVEPFVMFPTTMASMFLIRYVSTGFAWLMYLSSSLTALGFAAMVLLSLRDLWRRPLVSAPTPGARVG